MDTTNLTEAQKKLLERVLFESEQHQLAFVDDDFTEDEAGGVVYSPHVDMETAMEFMREKLIEAFNTK